MVGVPQGQPELMHRLPVSTATPKVLKLFKSLGYKLTTCHLVINNAGSGRWKLLGAKNKPDEHLLQFTQIQQSLGPSTEEVEISVQTTTSEKGVTKKSLQQIEIGQYLF